MGKKNKKKRGKQFEKGNKAHELRKSFGAFSKGNQVWRLRKANGSVPKFAPGELIDAFEKYVEWVIKNPLNEMQIVKYKEHYEEAVVPKMRPLTIGGFCNFAGMVPSTFALYGKRAATANEVTMIREYIFNNNYEGAAAGLLQHQLVARYIGLADKKVVDVNVVDMDEAEALEELKNLQAELVGILSDEGVREAVRQTYVDTEAIDDLPPPQQGNMFPSSPKPEPKAIEIKAKKKPRIIESDSSPKLKKV